MVSVDLLIPANAEVEAEVAGTRRICRIGRRKQALGEVDREWLDAVKGDAEKKGTRTELIPSKLLFTEICHGADAAALNANNLLPHGLRKIAMIGCCCCQTSVKKLM